MVSILTAELMTEWYEFSYKEKYSGEVYLELTFYSNNAPPVKRNVPRPSVHTYTPPSGLSHSGSITGMSLYIPPYAPGGGPPASSSVASSSSFADLGLPHHMRKHSMPVSLSWFGVTDFSRSARTPRCTRHLL